MAAVLLKLNQDQLEAIGTAGLVSVPSYDRSRLRAGILHFGVGNFHRAHQATFLDELFARGRSLDWAIVGAGVMPSDAKMREQLAAQDFLSTVVELESEEARARVIGPMVDFLPVGDSEAIIGRLADQDIRIVSLTITEGGYFIDPATGGFNAEHPNIQADAKCRHKPSTVFGLIVAGLRRRWQAGLGPLAVMSCDNIPHNGSVTRNAVLGMAALLEEPALVDWICREVAFPSGMVDRITPATGDGERRLCRLHFGLDDGWPVFCEQFKQWVLEDNFPAGRPALEEVGVQFVPDVRPYELMKIRILNGGHAMVAYASALLDIHFVHDAIRHPLINGFVREVLLEEVVPSVPPVPGIRLAEYLDKVIERMANSGVGDTVGRLCFDGSNRQPKYIVPSIADGLRMGKDISGLALASALWCRYCVGSNEAGKPIGPNDPNWDRLQEKARLAKADPMAWLAMEDIYGEVAKEQKFRAAFAMALRSIWEKGTEVALREYLES